MITHRWKLGLVPFFACFATSALSGEALRTVALTGDHAPGTQVGARFADVNTPVLNSAGKTAFKATLAGSGINDTNDEGIWSEGSGSLRLIARKGSPAPGMPHGVNFHESGFKVAFTSPQLNSAGQTAFRAYVAGGGLDGLDLGLWSEKSGSLSLVARDGGHPPGTASGVTWAPRIFRIDAFAFNSAGKTAFYGFLQGGGVNSNNDSGIWSEGASQFALVARSGNHAPGTPNGISFRGFGDPMFRGPVLNSAGRTAFRAGLTGSGVDSENNAGIWLGESGSLTMIVQEGDEAPGTTGGLVFRALGFPVINSAGLIAFRGMLTGSGVDDTNHAGIWSGGSGSLNLVTRTGNQVPGMPDDVHFRNFSEPVVNSSGRVAFEASMVRSGVDVFESKTSIWSEGTGSLELVAQEGDQAPGAPNGLNFNVFNSPILNSAGQVAFYAFLTGSSVDDTNNEGIWAEDRAGTLRLIVRKGQQLKVASQDYRTVSSLAFFGGSGNGDGRRSGFNDLGQTAFLATFTDGTSGVFVSNIAVVPEPATTLLLGSAAVAALFRAILLACGCRLSDRS